LLAFLIGMVCLAVTVRLDYRRLVRFLPLLAAAVLAMLVAVHFGGIDANGARRWLKLGVKFQPSEFAKLAAILMTAAYIGPLVEKGRRVTIFSWPVIVTGVMGFLVLKQPDMGTAVVIVGLSLILYLPSGIPKRQVYGLMFCAAMGTVYLVYAASYRAERIMAWLDPWSYEQTSGYQTVQALLAIGSGSFWGTGLGMGASKFHYCLRPIPISRSRCCARRWGSWALPWCCCCSVCWPGTA
jgi:cell division protein FtsW